MGRSCRIRVLSAVSIEPPPDGGGSIGLVMSTTRSSDLGDPSRNSARAMANASSRQGQLAACASPTASNLTVPLKERGIALVSLEERIDTGSAAGELIFHVFGAIAHFERRLIAERTKDGILAARARGKRPGRQPLDRDKVAAALKLVAAGLSPSMAARQLGLGRSTIYREVSRAGIQRGT